MRVRMGVWCNCSHLTDCNLPIRGYFSHHGNSDLEGRKNISEIMLASQFVISFVVGCRILYGIGTFGVWKRKLRDLINIRSVGAIIFEKKDLTAVDSDDSLRSSNDIEANHMRICQCAFMFLKVYMLCVACVLWYYWPSRRSQGSNFSLLVGTNFGLGFTVAGLSVWASIILQVIAASFFIWIMTAGA